MLTPLLIACDFDGTVTTQDTLVEILNAFGDRDWRRIQEKVVSGDLSIREGLEKEMGTVKASPEELTSFLRTRIRMEPTFPSFLKAMRARGIPLVLLSGGFDLCVEAVLGKTHLWPLPFLANRLYPRDGTGHSMGPRGQSHPYWEVEFPFPSADCQACGHCKADPIRAWNAQGYTTVFVGNGVTDRCPARVAGLTFAKGELLEWAAAQGIPVVPYSSFEDVEQGLKKRGWL